MKQEIALGVSLCLLAASAVAAESVYRINVSENHRSFVEHGGTSSSPWFHKADWLDFNSIQSGHHFGSDSYAFVRKDYALGPAKPTVDMEPAYENHPTGKDKPSIDAHQARCQAYSAMLAGAARHGYGALDLFYFYKDADGPFPKLTGK